MSRTARKGRRCWVWLVVGMALLLIGGPLAWRLRPLNSTELRLTGDWKALSPSLEIIHNPTYRLKRNRRYSLLHAGAVSFGGRAGGGTWSCSGDMLSMDPDPPRGLGSWDQLRWGWNAFIGRYRQRMKVSFEPGGRVRIEDVAVPLRAEPRYWIPSDPSIWPD